MESIYQSTIMKVINKVIRGFCLLLLVMSVCAVSGCAAARDEIIEEKADKENLVEKEEADRNDDKLSELREKKEEEPKEEQENIQEEEKEETEGKEPVTMAQLMGGSDTKEESGNAEPLPDTILWFNATYAPLTYSNGWNWKLISGLEQTESNIELQKMLLYSSWGVRDRESALETVKWLKEEGHRESCRECMAALEQLGMLDLEEEEFMESFMEAGIEENAFRYVMAYYMHQEGLEPDYIAAWDLCRVNQMYADFYFCGYMTYEEAMDASLENSLLLQQMYPSWEEMVEAYMAGYQFWQSDPCLTDDSPTMERYRYYEMLLEKKDGPYTLDWNMELVKSW